jgi:hypothetical protein
MQQGSLVAEVRVNKLAANVVGGVLALPCCAVPVFVAHLLPNCVAFAPWHLAGLLVALILVGPVHEAVHAVGLIGFAGVSWRDIRFGVMWEALMPYCHCKVIIPLRGYRRMALLPLWVTGGATTIALLLYPTDWLGLLAGVAIASCIGDLWIVAKLRHFADDFYIEDSPSEIGCDVYSNRQ